MKNRGWDSQDQPCRVLIRAGFNGEAFAGLPVGDVNSRMIVMARLYQQYEDQLAAYARGDRKDKPKVPMNRAYSTTVGWLGPWMVQPPSLGPTALGPTAVEYAADPQNTANVGRITLDLGTTIPEIDNSETKVNIGTLELGLVLLALILGPFALFEERFNTLSTQLLAPDSPKSLAAAAIALLLASDVVLPIPSSVVSTASGALFGFWAGAFISWAGMSAGSLLALFIRRRLGRPGLRKIVGCCIAGFTLGPQRSGHHHGRTENHQSRHTRAQCLHRSAPMAMH